MSIFSYYVSQQQYANWKEKFQSTARQKSGKVFSFTSTNYRNILNFLKDLKKFERNMGIDRTRWDKLNSTGQEVDKQRVVPLTNAGLIHKDIDTYYLDSKGIVCLDIINKIDSETDQWILLYLILLGYNFEGRKNDIILTTREMFEYLANSGVSENQVLDGVRNIIHLDSLEALFSTDIFWYITFAKDSQFIRKYDESDDEDKQRLYDYVINEQKKENSKDLIGHKFVKNGQMLKRTFIEEAEILYITRKICSRKYKDFDMFVNYVLNVYKDLHSNSLQNVELDFIKNKRSVYEDIFNHINLKEENNEQ